MTTTSPAGSARPSAETTAPFPNFFIIGAMRSGTTALARYVGAHPDVYVAPEKEVHFFDRFYDRGLDWYRSRFAGAGAERAIGEATQTYMYLPEVLPRLAEAAPDARLIAILRNPVDRAYSHYWLNRSFRVETLDFRAATAAGLDRPVRRRQDFAYVERGRYLVQLERVCEYFPRKALHVVLFEDLIHEPGETFASVCRFLDVDPEIRPSNLGDSINRHLEFRSLRLRSLSRRLPRPMGLVVGRLNARPVDYPPMDEAVRRELSQRFAEDNAHLAGWLGRDLSAWDAPAGG